MDLQRQKRFNKGTLDVAQFGWNFTGFRRKRGCFPVIHIFYLGNKTYTKNDGSGNSTLGRYDSARMSPRKMALEYHIASQYAPLFALQIATFWWLNS